jgi:hypothetical protein
VTFDSSLTGYTFMGGASAYANTPDSHPKPYLLVQPLNYDYSGANYWGYTWLKFDDIGQTTVPSAQLHFNVLGVGSMTVTPATEPNPAILSAYDAGTFDVADLAASWDLREDLRDALDASSPLATVAATTNGDHWIDITSLYNGWVSGTIANHGLILAAPDNGAGSKIASFGDPAGTPYIQTVPEPSTLALIGVFFVAFGIARRIRGRHAIR